MIGVKPLFSGRSLGEGENATFDVVLAAPDGTRARAQRPALRAAQGRDQVPVVSPRRRLGLRAGEDHQARRRRAVRRRRRQAGAHLGAGAMGPLSPGSVDQRSQRTGDVDRLRCRLVRGGERRHAGPARNRARQAGIRAGRQHDGRRHRAHRRQGHAQRDRRPADHHGHPGRGSRAPRGCASRSATTGAAAPMWSQRLRRPLDTRAERMPGRAIGVQWFSINRKARTLALDLELPTLLRPNSALRIPVKVGGLSPGEEARIVVAAVDVGILNLTNYKPPAPDDYYLGQRRLTADIRDLYGQLIDGMQGARGQIRTGGDAARGRAAGLAAHAEAARALFRHRHRQARRHRRGRVRHPRLRRHRARDGGGLVEGQGRPRGRRRHHPRSGGAHRDAAAFPAQRRPRHHASRSRQCRRTGRRLPAGGEERRRRRRRQRRAADAAAQRQAAQRRRQCRCRRPPPATPP